RIMFNIKLDDLCEKTTNSGQVRMLPNPSAENIMKVVLEKLRVQFKLDQKEIDIDDKIEQLATLVDGLLNVVKTEQNDLESRRYLPDSAANIMAFTPLKRFVAQRNEPLDELIDLLSHYQAQVANLKLTSHNSPKVVLVVVGS
ncbi:MAG TPA: hypothetical protein VLG38_08365, partial [Gammaproteobacteria bacterium]|nr:hypothetical protein [Gammaproteobacteria bacterium]